MTKTEKIAAVAFAASASYAVKNLIQHHREAKRIAKIEAESLLELQSIVNAAKVVKMWIDEGKYADASYADIERDFEFQRIANRFEE